MPGLDFARNRALVAATGDVVAFLETLGIRPGTVVTVREHHPFDGPVVVTVDGVERVVGHKLAQEIYVANRKVNTK